MKVCSQCSARMKDSARFCTRCGAPLESGASAPVSGTKKPSSRKLAAIGIGAAALVVLLAVVLLTGRPRASAMSLSRLEGTVAVFDDKGAQVTPKDNLKLYSGYGVQTRPVSYAWISLDQMKLVKMDQKSEIAIEKESNLLEIEVKSGSLFFNVAQPLAGDEAMNIRTSTMLVGIRGTCGWVVSNGARGAQVFLLEGTVEAEAADTGERVQVTAGHMAEVTVNENGETEITIRPFGEEYIAPFVLTELENDDALCAAILEASGLDVLNPPDLEEHLQSKYLEIIAQQTVHDHYAAAGAAYAANGISYSADSGLSKAFLSDLDGDGTQELIMVFSSHSDDFYNSAPLQKIEVYGQSMGHPVLYDTLDVTDFHSGEDCYVNQFRLIENGTGQTIQLYANYAEGGVIFESFWYFSFENGTFNLLENHREPRESDWDWLSNGDEMDLENLRPDFPEDVRRKQALLSAFVSYEGFTDGFGRIYARLIDVNQDGEDELFMILDKTYDGLRMEYYTWDGTDLNCVVLASEPGDIVYGRFMDMDQDGEEELILILEDYSGAAYSWKGASWERCILHEAPFEDIPYYISGLYRDTVTGDIFLGSTDWALVGAGAAVSYDSLTQHLDYACYTRPVVSDHFDGRMYDELTPEEQEEADRLVSEEWAKFRREIERFELVDEINLSGNEYGFLEPLQYTVDEVRRQLTAR